MTANDKRPGPLAEEPGRYDRHPVESDDHVVRLTVARERETWSRATKRQREFDSLVEAVRHLNEFGSPASVPPQYVARMRRLGLDVWAADPRRVA